MSVGCADELEAVAKMRDRWRQAVYDAVDVLCEPMIGSDGAMPTQNQVAKLRAERDEAVRDYRGLRAKLVRWVEFQELAGGAPEIHAEMLEALRQARCKSWDDAMDAMGYTKA